VDKCVGATDSWQRGAEEAEEVFAEDAGDVVLAVAAGAEEGGDFLEVGDRLEVERGLLGAEGAVEVAAEADVAGVADELAVVIDVIDESGEVELRRLRGGLATYPVWHHHPRVEADADDGAAGGEGAELVVGELALVRDERAGIMVTGPDRAAVAVEGLPEAVVAEVGDVEDEAEVIGGAEEIEAARGEGAGGTGALRVDAGAVVRGAEGAEAIGVGAREVAGRDEGVGAFEAAEVADGEGGGGGGGGVGGGEGGLGVRGRRGRMGRRWGRGEKEEEGDVADGGDGSEGRGAVGCQIARWASSSARVRMGTISPASSMARYQAS
jgi:hypothetical protein